MFSMKNHFLIFLNLYNNRKFKNLIYPKLIIQNVDNKLLIILPFQVICIRLILV